MHELSLTHYHPRPIPTNRLYAGRTIIVSGCGPILRRPRNMIHSANQLYIKPLGRMRSKARPCYPSYCCQEMSAAEAAEKIAS